MRKVHLVALAAAAAVSVLHVGTARATDPRYSELPGNVFSSKAVYGDFWGSDPTVYTPGKVVVNQAQGIVGGDQKSIGSWPVSGDSALTDGDLESFWQGGKAYGQDEAQRPGLKAETLVFSAGQMQWGSVPGQVNPEWVVGPKIQPSTFGAIETIRIWAPDSYGGSDGLYQVHPQHIRIDYTMNDTARWATDGFNAAANICGDLRDPNNVQGDGNPTNGGYVHPAEMYPSHAVITAVNGSTPTLDGDWVQIDDAFVNGDYVDHYGQTLHYVDLTVSIPQGAYSIAFEFGQTGPTTGNFAITEIQAVPEPASLGLLGLAAAGLLARRRTR